MRILYLLLLAACALAADIVDPKDCKEFPCLIFNDEFDFFDHDVWEHEVTMSGGWNSQFEVYVNNRSVTYTRDSTFFIKPALVSEWKGEDFLTSGYLNLWGINGRGDVCTGNGYMGCERKGTPENLIPPILSAKLRTMSEFAFKYGRIEIRAKMPSGDWLWPAIIMFPKNWPYGVWPASGEITLTEARGNDKYGEYSNQYAGTTMHWGPFRSFNRYNLTEEEYKASKGTFADSFHTWRMDWTKDKIEIHVDDVLVMTVDPGTSFWDFGGFGDDIDNIWSSGEKMAPFDQKFYIILDLAVGGVGGFFPDDVPGASKPWNNTSPTPNKDFWNGRADWLPTWQHGESRISEKAALQVDYVKVWKMESVEQ
ncbi:beta-1,3-glucan-binding protein-like isoform X2 [Macrobrachium nipponense]